MHSQNTEELSVSHAFTRVRNHAQGAVYNEDLCVPYSKAHRRQSEILDSNAGVNEHLLIGIFYRRFVSYNILVHHPNQRAHYAASSCV